MGSVSTRLPLYRRGLWSVLLAGIVALLLSVAACSSDDEPTASTAPADTGPKSGGTLKVGMLADHVTFDPPIVVGLPDLVTVQHTYDVLVFRNPDLTLQPALAESWDTNADASQWTFNLRKGVKFSHGKELKAEDVIFTFNRMFEVESPLASVMAKPTNMVAVDDYTVRMEFDGPNAPLLESLVKYHAHVTPSDVDPARFATETFGTGPWRVAEHIVGERTVFEPNSDSWWWDRTDGGKPYLDELIWVFLPSPESRAEALKAGTVDMLYDMDTSSIPTIESHSETSVQEAPSGGYMNLAMDVREAPFDDKLVRKAIQAATDRRAVLQGAQFGRGSIAYDHPITDTNPVFNPSCKPPDYSPALAKDLLKEAGYPNGIDLTLHTASAGAALVEMATVLKESFAPAGINLDIVVMPEDGYWAEGWMVKPFTTVWWGGRPPYEAFSVVYSSGAAWNESFWHNAQADALLKEALGAATLAEQKRIYGELQCLVVEEVPRIVIVFRPVVLGIRNDVRGSAPMWDATLSLHQTWLDR